jgi:hypothetical protein
MVRRHSKIFDPMLNRIVEASAAANGYAVNAIAIRGSESKGLFLINWIITVKKGAQQRRIVGKRKRPPKALRTARNARTDRRRGRRSMPGRSTCCPLSEKRDAARLPAALIATTLAARANDAHYRAAEFRKVNRVAVIASVKTGRDGRSHRRCGGVCGHQDV